MSDPSSNPWPTDLRVVEKGSRLAVSFDNGERFELSAEYLRVESPSAEVQGHSPAERKTVSGKRDVRLVTASPVGNYAVKLGFDDGHDSGLFTWSYLLELGRNQPTVWAAYLAALEAKGLTR